MLELNNALELIVKGIGAKTDEYGFRPEYPDGIFPPNLPVEEVNGKSIIMYRGERGRIRLEYENGKLGLFCAKESQDDTPDDDMPRASLSLLDLETFNEKDIKYICQEYNETFEKLFSHKPAHSGKKAPTPVSRSQAKSGVLAYDANTLGSRFTTVYPELRDEYKANLEAYGEFLAEDFFTKHGNAVDYLTALRYRRKSRRTNKVAHYYHINGAVKHLQGI